MNFGRVVRMAIRYKFTFAASIVSALIVAVLWGAIISTVYPVVEVVFKNKSMQQWIDGNIGESQATIAAKSADLGQLRQQLAAAEKDGDQQLQRKLLKDIANTEDECAKTSWDLWASELAKPYIDAYLPHDPFHTLVLITALLLLGTVVKDVFLVANNVLVARLGSTGRLRFAEARSTAARCGWTWPPSARMAPPI